MNLDALKHLYSPNPPYAIQQIVEHYNQGYSVIILVCSKQRGGKSKKAYILANWLSGLIFKKSWDWHENTLIGVDNLTEQLGNGIFVMDEVQLQLSRKKSMTAPSQMMFDLTSTQAYHHYILILICPRANTLGIDHANDLDFVFPIHYRKTLMPYRVKTNQWDLTADPRKIPKEPLGHWDLDIENPLIKWVFKDELTHLDEYIKFIEVNIKQKQIEDSKEKAKERREKKWIKQFL